MASFPARTVHAVEKADIGQMNAALKLTKMANPFRETSKGVPTPAPPPPIRAYRTAINIREFKEIQFPTFVQPPAEAQGLTWSPPTS